jgi:hypothetical protein
VAYPRELTELETADGEATAGARGPRGPRAYPSRTHRVRPTPIEPNPKGQGLPQRGVASSKARAGATCAPATRDLRSTRGGLPLSLVIAKTAVGDVPRPPEVVERLHHYIPSRARVVWNSSRWDSPKGDVPSEDPPEG